MKGQTVNLPGLPEFAIIFLIIMLLFGAKQLPKIAKSLGQTIKEARNISKELND